MGPELPLSSLSEKSLEHQAAPPVLPSACLHSLRHTTLPPTPFLLSAQAPAFTRLLPDDACTSLGCRAEKSPRWQPFKPPSLQHRSHPQAP